MIAIVLVNWNGKANTLACLKTLTRLEKSDARVIVCDNGSVDGSARAFLEWGERSGGAQMVRVPDGPQMPASLDRFLTIVDIGANLGFAGANNVGIALALADASTQAVWLLNNDTAAHPAALSALGARMAEDPAIGICGSTLICFDNRQKVQSLGVRYNLALGRGHQMGAGLVPDKLPQRDNVERALSYVSGASMLVSRAFLETVGLMEARYFLYFEELDWALRNQGRFKLGWAPGSVVFHRGSASSGPVVGGRASAISVYYLNHNLLRVVARFRPYYLPLTFLRLAVLIARFLLRRDAAGGRLVWRAAVDFVTGRTRLPPSGIAEERPAKNIVIIDPLGRHGGFHYYVDGLARGLAQAGARVSVCVTAFTGADGRQPYEVVVSFADLYGPDPLFVRGVRYLRGSLAAARLARRRRADIVICHIFTHGPREVAAVWLARLFVKKVVLTLHEVEGGSRLSRALIRAPAAGYIFHNSFSLAAFERRGGAGGKPRAVIPHGHYCDNFRLTPTRSAARVTLGLPAQPVVFLFFGNPRPDKGLDLLFRACAGLKQHPGWMLVVAGKMKPGQRATCQTLIDRYGLGALVRIDARYIGDAQTGTYFAAANLVVVPYSRACESGVAIMAMSLGRAVLVADLEPLVETVAGGDAGLIFKSGDAEALSKALIQALDDPAALDTLGKRARANVVSQRDWAKIGVATDRFVEILINRS